jgi:hypothetical protein
VPSVADERAVTTRVQVAGSAFAVLVLACAVALGYSVFSTSQARVSATTENTSSVFGTVDIELIVQPEDGGTEPASSQLLFDATGLYPGKVVTSCVALTARSDLPLDIRLHGRREGGSGLDEFVELTVEAGVGGATGDCGGFSTTATIFEGRLVAMWRDHPTFEAGVPIAETDTDGDGTGVDLTLTLRATATVVDDNAAMGRDTTFWMTVEARP